MCREDPECWLHICPRRDKRPTLSNLFTMLQLTTAGSKGLYVTTEEGKPICLHWRKVAREVPCCRVQLARSMCASTVVNITRTALATQKWKFDCRIPRCRRCHSALLIEHTSTTLCAPWKCCTLLSLGLLPSIVRVEIVKAFLHPQVLHFTC